MRISNSREGLGPLQLLNAYETVRLKTSASALLARSVRSSLGDEMTNVFDVAAYILEKTGPITAMKLQKLVYYSQAWSLVWDEEKLFPQRVEAWANGPVAPELYRHFRGTFKVSTCGKKGDSSKLTADQFETVDSVLKYYSDRDPQWLSDLTHSESPWKDARLGMSPGERGNQVITPAAMAEYYGSL
jgi:uncharacterized phage-associated protein